MSRCIFSAIGVLLLSTSIQAREYLAGQLWSYEARPGDDKSLVLIDLVESAPDKSAIYHVSVLGAHIPTRRGGPRLETDLPHFPVSKETLDKSLLELVGKRSPHESFRAGYDIWRSAFDDGRAGIFTISIAEIVAIVESQIPPGPT